jgi:hypothetical protein
MAKTDRLSLRHVPRELAAGLSAVAQRAAWRHFRVHDRELAFDFCWDEWVLDEPRSGSAGQQSRELNGGTHVSASPLVELTMYLGQAELVLRVWELPIHLPLLQEALGTVDSLLPTDLRDALLTAALHGIAELVEGSGLGRPAWSFDPPRQDGGRRLLGRIFAVDGTTRGLMAEVRATGDDLVALEQPLRALPSPRHSWPDLVITSALEIASFSWTLEKLRALAAGDLVILSLASNSPDVLAGRLVVSGYGTFPVKIHGHHLSIDGSMMNSSSDTHHPELLPSSIDQIRVDVKCILSDVQMTVGEVGGLAPGTIITLPGDPIRSAQLRVTGQVVATGEIVSVGDSIAFLVTSVANSHFREPNDAGSGAELSESR